MTKHKFIAVILLGVVLDKTCLADSNDVTQVGSYLTVTNKASFAQTHLLSQSIQLRFTRNIQTVGDAIHTLLQLSGYTLVPKSQQSTALKIMLSNPLPVIDRELGPIKLRDGLTILAGPAFYLAEDPVNRTVNFKLRPGYRKFLKFISTSRSSS